MSPVKASVGEESCGRRERHTVLLEGLELHLEARLHRLSLFAAVASDDGDAPVLVHFNAARGVSQEVSNVCSLEVCPHHSHSVKD